MLCWQYLMTILLLLLSLGLAWCVSSLELVRSMSNTPKWIAFTTRPTYLPTRGRYIFIKSYEAFAEEEFYKIYQVLKNVYQKYFYLWCSVWGSKKCNRLFWSWYTIILYILDYLCKLPVIEYFVLEDKSWTFSREILLLVVISPYHGINISCLFHFHFGKAFKCGISSFSRLFWSG